MTKYNETKEEYIARMKRIVANSQQAQNAIRDHKTRSATEERVGKQKGKPKPNPYTDPNMKEWEDYKECPITGMRHRNLKASHPNGKALPQTDAEEYFYHFPELQGMSKAATKKNSEAQLQLAYDEHGSPVLDDNGKHLTVNQVVQLKKAITMNEVDEATGKTKNQLLGEKSGNTRKNGVDELGMSIQQRTVAERTYLRDGAKSKAGLWESYDEFITYVTLKSGLKDEITGYEDLHSTFYIESEKNGTKQVDHRFSRSEGYKNGISVFAIAHPANTEIVDFQRNRDKHHHCSITLEELLHITGYSKERSEYEFELGCAIIEELFVNTGLPFNSLRFMRVMYDLYDREEWKEDFKKMIFNINFKGSNNS